MTRRHDSYYPKRSRFSFANVIAIVALFVALGGSAYAVSKAPKNSVYSSSIKNGQVKISDLARKAVKNKNVAKETLTGNRIKDGQVGSSELGDGAVRAAKLGPIVERSSTIQVINGSQNATTVSCNSGEKVIGGGANWDFQNVNARLQLSYMVDNGWRVGAQNASGANKQLTVYAYCLGA